MREFVRHIADERADILAFLAGVGGDDWSRDTPCAGWSLKDVLAHMVEGELAVGRVYRGEVHELAPADPEEGIARWRALPGVAVRAALWQHGTATQRVLDRMSDDQSRAPIRVLGCRTVGQLVRLHLFELCVHGHDLTDALAGPPLWGPRLGFLVELVARAAPRALERSGVRAGSLELRVPALGLAWSLTGRDGSWRSSPGDGDAAATVELDPEDLVLSATGRRAVADALERAGLDGDRVEAARILEGVRIV